MNARSDGGQPGAFTRFEGSGHRPVDRIERDVDDLAPVIAPFANWLMDCAPDDQAIADDAAEPDLSRTTVQEAGGSSSES